MKLDKIPSVNSAINSAIGVTINEYDIKRAYTLAIKYVKGPELGKKIMSMPKLEANAFIGKMMIEDKDLHKQLNDKVLQWINDFIESNRITESNYVETTKDSILFIGKIPTKLTFGADNDVHFINKDGEYTSLYRVNNKLILFDSMRNNIRIKGVNSSIVELSPFVNLYLKPLLSAMETSSSIGLVKCMRSMEKYRIKYIDFETDEIYRELNNENKFAHNVDGEIVYLGSILNDDIVIKHGNYNDYVLPIMRNLIK